MKKKIIGLFILFILYSFYLEARDYLTLSGETLSSQDLESQDKTILLFWTTWCPYCRAQIKSFSKVCPEFLAKGFKIFFINIQDSREKVRIFKEKMKITCPIILDSSASLAYKYRILGIPTYIFLKRGREIGRTNFITKEEVKNLYGE